MTMFRSSFFLVSIFVFTSAVIVAAIFSQSALAVTVGPPKLEYRTDPGSVISGIIVLSNEGETPQIFYPAFEKFIEVNGEKKFLPAEPTTLAGWFKLPENVALGPKGQKQVSFVIDVPKNAPPGGHFAVMWWGTGSPTSKEVAIVTRAGILVYLQVSGKVNEAGKLTSFFSENNQFIFVGLPQNFEVKFKNVGNTYLKPQGDIIIKNIFGTKNITFGVNEGGLIILPDAESNLRISKHFNETPFALGFYKAEINLRWGEKPESIQKNIWFFVFPWQYVLAVIAILTVLLFGAGRGIKKYNQWVISKYSKTN